MGMLFTWFRSRRKVVTDYHLRRSRLVQALVVQAGGAGCRKQVANHKFAHFFAIRQIYIKSTSMAAGGERGCSGKARTREPASRIFLSNKLEPRLPSQYLLALQPPAQQPKTRDWYLVLGGKGTRLTRVDGSLL
jgi:hypothetical protein